MSIVTEAPTKERINKIVGNPATHLQSDYEPLWQVILYDDNVHTVEQVVKDICKTFKHPIALAVKIVIAVGKNGKEIVDVEPKADAQAHKDLMQSAGYTISIEPVV